MGLGECLVLGVALAMDAFAVTVSNTLAAPGARRRRLLLMPLLFGLFQGLMTLLGSLLGSLFGDVIERFSGLVALVVLGAIGVNMVREGLGALRSGTADKGGDCGGEGAAEEGGDRGGDDVLSLGRLLLEAVATSIDAFAVGVSLRAMGVATGPASAVIGLVTAALCVAAIACGRWAGPRLGDRAQVAGGVVLVALGIKAFFF
ncbi:manganese efflux pump MntP family protein [Caniella muris]|uniref:manganese efflux pump MntP n=1 Tax=Caniella muris TaxID=2941502 RepID=UPI00203D8FBD|nr:manganese efflux pump [Caniella muris]